jgi:acyl-CoA reductase-like NAD-dependent aldehyde dehydrogenase
VEAAVLGTFLHQGQICMAVNRIIVEAPLYDEFVTRFTAAASGVPVGDPASMQTLVGPVVNDSQLEGLKAKIAAAKAGGARTALEGGIRGRVVPRTASPTSPPTWKAPARKPWKPERSESERIQYQ